MQRVKLIIAIGLLALVSGSCKKFLTEEPLTQVPTENYFKSLKDVNAAMAGMYASFQQDMTLGGMFHYWGEGRSDNFDRSQYTGATAMSELSINTLTSGNSSSNWTGLYRTIGRANTNIKFIPQAASFDNTITLAIKNNNLAQCYAMRAMCYFYILRVWGGAPIWTEPYLDVTQTAEKARNTKEEVLAQIIIDLDNAYTLIPKGANTNVWYISEAAICALMADVQMWKKDYSAAITWIQRVFAAKAATGKVFAGTAVTDLVTSANWRTLFLQPAGTIENIWSINWVNANNGCACIPISIANNNNPVAVDSTLHANWKRIAGDIRPKWTYDTLTGTGHIDKVIKYHNIAGNAFPTGTGAPQPITYDVYLVMYRLADVFLLYAEALNKTGDAPNALKYLNFIRQRAGVPPYLATDPLVATPEAMERTILLERRYELFAEGKRWFDLVRTGKVNEVMDPVLNQRFRRLGTAEVGFGADQNKILWPIHRNVLEDNRQLVQNPSYN